MSTAKAKKAIEAALKQKSKHASADVHFSMTGPSFARAIKSTRKNENGLTLRRWLAAIGVEMREDVRNSHVRAWERGEDPSDYRAGR